jgi:transcriptional regulator with XRE-family HTH domain
MDIQTRIEQFAQGMRWSRRQDGDPPYREISRQMGYSISSISRVLSGKSFPRWHFTEQFLRACHVPEEHISGRWHTRWLEIAELIDPLGDFPYQADAEADPGPALAAPAGPECTECGALMINPLRHQAWHMQYVRRPAAARDRRPLTAAAPTHGTTLHRLSS